MPYTSINVLGIYQVLRNYLSYLNRASSFRGSFYPFFLCWADWIVDFCKRYFRRPYTGYGNRFSSILPRFPVWWLFYILVRGMMNIFLRPCPVFLCDTSSTSFVRGMTVIFLHPYPVFLCYTSSTNVVRDIMTYFSSLIPRIFITLPFAKSIIW